MCSMCGFVKELGEYMRLWCPQVERVEVAREDGSLATYRAWKERQQ